MYYNLPNRQIYSRYFTPESFKKSFDKFSNNEDVRTKIYSVICGIIYRQHNSPEVFQTYFEDTVEKFALTNKTLYRMGDLNVDLLKPFSETQGQIVGARESLNGRENVARRKLKNGEKSPWGQCLTRPVPNGRRRSGF